MKYTLLILFALTTFAHADTTYDWPRLEKIHRIAVVSPFFDAQPGKTTTHAQKTTPGGKTSKKSDATLSPAQYLHRLTLTMNTALPHALADSNRYQVISSDDVARALRALHWTARDLFLPRGMVSEEAVEARREQIENDKRHGLLPSAQDRMNRVQGNLPLHGKHKSNWLEPNAARIALLARRLHADAVFVGTMADPTSVHQGIALTHSEWSPNPVNIALRRFPAHVLSPRVQGFLVTPERAIVWSDEEIAEHPRTKPTTQRTLLVDYQEATQEVAQLLADSLTRLPPP